MGETSIAIQLIIEGPILEVGILRF